MQPLMGGQACPPIVVPSVMSSYENNSVGLSVVNRHGVFYVEGEVCSFVYIWHRICMFVYSRILF